MKSPFELLYIIIKKQGQPLQMLYRISRIEILQLEENNHFPFE